MAANPTIKAVSATKDAISTYIMALLENTSRGMVQMRACLTPSCTTFIVESCTTTINSTTVTTNANFSTVVIGMKVTGTGIATDTYVTAIASATSLTINKNATATASGTTLTFGPEDMEMRVTGCLERSDNIYISEIYRLASLYKESTTTATSAGLRAYTCSSGENCDTLACDTWNSSYNFGVNNISIETAFGNTPIDVSNLTLTPGDKSISVSWGDVNQTTSIWAYWVILSQGATQMVSGWTQKKSILISKLINGTEYTVKVKAGSFDGYSGLFTEKTATPVAACIPPVCTLTME